MKEIRIEKHIITKYHPMFKICSDYTWYSKNLYNHANYIIRQHYFKTKEFLNYHHMRVVMKTEESFKTIGSNAGQMTLKLLERAWKSYFAICKEWSKNPSKLLGKPKPPNYLDKNKGKYLVTLTNLQTRIEDGYLFFAFKPFKPFNKLIKTKVESKLSETRIVPRDGYYVLEIVYQITVPNLTTREGRIIGIDLGLDNLMTIQNNYGWKPIVINGKPLKSINHYYNMKKAKIQSKLKKVNNEDWSKNLAKLIMKRNNKVDNYIHRATRYVVDYCIDSGVDTVIIGKNKEWKQNFKRQGNFIQIPYEKLIHQLQYKLREIGIKVVLTEESYTSKASFIDMDEMVKGVAFSGERVKRGLYKSRNNTLINADVNGASNIIRKVFPDIFDGIKGVHLHPLIMNL